jgi:predicted house-cleaning noncanonical NTP pyrophosphatase (MazG superfamily)
LKDSIDAIVKKGIELSPNITIEEQYSIMKKLIREGIDKVVQNFHKNKEVKFTEKEFEEKKNELERFVQEYFDKKFSEKIAQNWEMKQK